MNGRAVFLDACASVRRNWTTVAVFIAVVSGCESLVRLLSLAFAGDSPLEELPPLLRAVDLCARILLAAGYSAAQAIAFARLGKDIDRPLWKCSGDYEALARYFTPWFILNLFLTLLWTLRHVAAVHESIGGVQLLEFLSIVLCVLCVPTGACIVYGGGLHWERLGQLLAPMVRQFPLAAVSMFFGLLGYTLFLLADAVIPGIAAMTVAPALLTALLALLDCLAFAAMWRVCMIQRDAPPGEDFDFY